MIAINSSSTPEIKFQRIGLYSKLTILINGLLIAITLMIGWTLWLTIARDALDNYLKWFNNNPSQSPISFNEITIIVFIITALTLILVIPFIFIKTKNGISALSSLINFIFATILIINVIIFLIIKFDTFTFLAKKADGDATNTTSNFIIVFLPWLLATLFAMLLLIHSLSLTINITAKYKSNAQLMPIAKPKTNLNSITATQETDDVITIPSFIETTITPTATTNIEQQTSNETNTTTTVNYTNHQLSPTPVQGAYHAEAVPPTPDTITNLQPEAITPQSTNSTIYSRPTATTNLVNSEYSKYDDLSPATTEQTTTETNTNIDTNYQPKNQGGFDIQDHNNQTNENTNVNHQSTTITDNYQSVTINNNLATQKVTNHHWTAAQIEAVWEKGEIISGVSDKLYRKDYAGAWMFRDSFTSDYAVADNLETYSWTIVLHRPTNQQGTTELYNLDPMNIVNAKSKGENYPSWKTKISSKGNKNISKEQNWKART